MSLHVLDQHRIRLDHERPGWSLGVFEEWRLWQLVHGSHAKCCTDLLQAFQPGEFASFSSFPCFLWQSRSLIFRSQLYFYAGWDHVQILHAGWLLLISLPSQWASCFGLKDQCTFLSCFKHANDVLLSIHKYTSTQASFETIIEVRTFFEKRLETLCVESANMIQ